MRLAQGDFSKMTLYGDPVEQAMAFAGAGADWIHIVDLDGAVAGRARQTAIIGAIARASCARVQCGGGVRSAEDIAALLDAGASRVVVGSAAVSQPELMLAWLDEFGPDQLCGAFDGRAYDGGFMVATHGWTKSSGVGLEDAINRFPAGALRHALVTDVSRDGVLAGPNADLYAALVRRFPPVSFQASGGVSALQDLELLKSTGVGAAIVGRALYERRFSLEEALAC